MIGDTTQVMQTGFSPKTAQQPAQEALDKKRQDLEKDGISIDKAMEEVPPEEILDKIKSLTEDGAFSIRFEKNDDMNKLVVKLVDRQTDEVVRQIPTEDLLDTLGKLSDLRGNIVDTAI